MTVLCTVMIAPGFTTREHTVGTVEDRAHLCVVEHDDPDHVGTRRGIGRRRRAPGTRGDTRVERGVRQVEGAHVVTGGGHVVAHVPAHLPEPDHRDGEPVGHGVTRHRAGPFRS